ncbi:OsmC family protein [Acetohalobium arabaticum]|uniref:OsmC family protein n=1 Tax=Acetohalobium arabaticum (strain ATCC 49924 / DSM 5501 / Z-7288) TaxID=574087 RepID=D9QVC4_ACEAZ|nr:OsmC family protein [Acetohalobium arabaticum]ADL12183.1 OsmC family protein [Acetohalobium arabaticum DSM 5501]
MSEETFTATVNLLEGVTVEAESRGHKIIMDEPEKMGGTDEGMNPVELTLCSLGGCLSICASMFAKSCDVELNDFSVELEGDIDLSGFKGADNVDPGFQDVRFTLYIDSDSPEENIKELVELIENRCPVSDSLQRNITIAGDYEIK